MCWAAVTKDEAAKLLQTDEGRNQLSPERGAVAVKLLALGREAFIQTFGNEVFFTEVTGILDGPLNIGNLTKAIAALGGTPQTSRYLWIGMSQSQITFKAGTLLNTGLDVSAGSLVPLGIQTHISNGKVRAGVLAACHAAVDKQTGRILEGAPNTDLDRQSWRLLTQLHGSAKLVSIPPKFSLAIAPTSKQITRKRDYQTPKL